jgi:hypothetical protein
MAVKIRDLHGIAYNWNSTERLPINILEEMVKDWTEFGEEQIKRKPRPILRELINILDLCEENPELIYNDLIQIDSNEKKIVSQISSILNP